MNRVRGNGGRRLRAMRSSMARWIACGVLLSLALIPGLPKLSFVLMAVGVGLIARRLPAKSASPALAEEAGGAPVTGDKAKAADGTKGENLASLLKMDELTLEI